MQLIIRMLSIFLSTYTHNTTTTKNKCSRCLWLSDDMVVCRRDKVASIISRLLVWRLRKANPIDDAKNADLCWQYARCLIQLGQAQSLRQLNYEAGATAVATVILRQNDSTSSLSPNALSSHLIEALQQLASNRVYRAWNLMTRTTAPMPNSEIQQRDHFMMHNYKVLNLSVSWNH